MAINRSRRRELQALARGAPAAPAQMPQAAPPAPEEAAPADQDGGEQVYHCPAEGCGGTDFEIVMEPKSAEVRCKACGMEMPVAQLGK